MPVLVIAEHDNVTLKAATLNAVTAALQLEPEVHLFVGGDGCQPVLEAAVKVAGVTKVILVEAPGLKEGLAENFTPVLVNMARRYSAMLAPATTFGKNLLPRVAALLDVQQVSDVLAIVGPDTFRRPIYAGNAIATVQSCDPIKLLTIRTTAFPPAAVSGGSATVERLTAGEGDMQLSRFVSRTVSQSVRPELTAAKIIVTGGRALGSAENFKLIEALADKLGAAVGASRAAVDAGYVPNDLQVGQTGKIVAPILYIAIGVSGAIQHLAGMKDSKVIVAINKDADAPIFQVADFGLVADLFEAVPALTRAL